MEKKDFFGLIKKDQYQIFIFSSPVPLPFSIAAHSWIVINIKGNLKRWEILFWPNQCKTSWEHLHLNVKLPWEGWEVLPFLKLNFSSKLIGKIEGKKGSLAEKMTSWIDKNAKIYPYSVKYHAFPGPNSNTFIQWILNKFPESGLKLQWNAFGKGYNI